MVLWELPLQLSSGGPPFPLSCLVSPGEKFLVFTFIPSWMPLHLLASWGYSCFPHCSLTQPLISPKNCSKKSNAMPFTLDLRKLPDFCVVNLRAECSAWQLDWNFLSCISQLRECKVEIKKGGRGCGEGGRKRKPGRKPSSALLILVHYSQWNHCENSHSCAWF